jgi:hypothetical protein
MELEQAKWMITAGRAALDEPGAAHLATWQTSLLREQIELRRRSAARFPATEKWLWTNRSLAQASDWWCAQFKANLFPPAEWVVDGCCGVGVDLVALALRGSAVGIDRDEALVALANANLMTHGLVASACVGELPEDLPEGARWLHLDPDRRVADSLNRRLRSAEDYSPTLAESLALAKRTSGSAIKLAPSSLVEPEVERAFRDEVGLVRAWLGNLGECRQQVLVTGELSRRILGADKSVAGLSGESQVGTRLAVLCEPNAEPAIVAGRPVESCAGERTPRRFLYDCHAVLHAAQLQMAWAEPLGAVPLGTSQGYFTSDSPIRSIWAQCFEVLEVLPWDQRRVRRWLREHKIGEVEVKKRLLQLDANEHQRALRGAGDEKITLLITRLGDRVRAVVAKRT